MLIEIRQEIFDPWKELKSYQDKAELVSGSYGACVSFVGTMRDFNQNESIEQMELEYYQGMTEHQLKIIAEQVIDQYTLLDLVILHRVGVIKPNESIVLLAAWSAHRVAAFDGCRDLMEHLKTKATFWKKETIVHDGEEAEFRWSNPTA